MSTGRTPLFQADDQPSPAGGTAEITRLVSFQQVLPTHRLLAMTKTPLIVALGVYMAGGAFEFQTVGLTLVLSAMLWASLYALNEFTDLVFEDGLVGGKPMQAVLFALPPAVCLLATAVSLHLFVLFALMAVGQTAYCLPPLRLKRHWWAALALSGVTNPLLRLQCGAIWGVHAVPWLAYGVLVALHLGTGIRTRLLQRERDRRLGYSIASPPMHRVGMAISLAGFLGLFALYAQDVLPRELLVFAVLAMGFAVYGWSGRTTDMAQARKGWLGFAILSLSALIVLLKLR